MFAFDAADLQENLDDELAVGTMVDADPAESIESIRRLKAIAAERGYRVIPGHDPDAWPALTDQLGVPGPPDPSRERGRSRCGSSGRRRPGGCR